MSEQKISSETVLIEINGHDGTTRTLTTNLNLSFQPKRMIVKQLAMSDQYQNEDMSTTFKLWSDITGSYIGIFVYGMTLAPALSFDIMKNISGSRVFRVDDAVGVVAHAVWTVMLEFVP